MRLFNSFFCNRSLASKSELFTFDMTTVYFLICSQHCLNAPAFTVFTRVLVDPVYKSTPNFGAKTFFLFLCKNFLEKLLFYLRTSFQIRHGFLKKKNHRKLGRKVLHFAYLSIYACFSDTSISCIFFIIFEISLQNQTY